MDKLWKKYGLPLLIVIAGTLLWQLGRTLKLSAIAQEMIYTATLFSFGVSLRSVQKKRSSGWVGKLIICVVLTLFVLHRLAVFNLHGIVPFLALAGLTNQTIAVPLIYVWCGYLFFD